VTIDLDELERKARAVTGFERATFVVRPHPEDDDPALYIVTDGESDDVVCGHMDGHVLEGFALYLNSAGPLAKSALELIAEIRRLRRALATSTVRIGILLGRMRSCDLDNGDTHELSLFEGQGWIEEQREALGRKP
jgi:hypothetical protein